MGEGEPIAAEHQVPGPGPGRPGLRPVKRRRVLVSDARVDGKHLRTTWHREAGVFVVSTWAGDVCTGAIRVPVEAAPDLINLLVDGLAQHAVRPPGTVAERSRPASASPWGSLRRWLGLATGRAGKRSRAGGSTPAPVRRIHG